MAMEQNFLEPESHDGDVSLKHKWESLSAQSAMPDNNNGCFDCNICLDSAHEPVVTFCGHLYCWPCIYKWLHTQISYEEPEQQQKCPVCKANISLSSLVPLYGRGTSDSDSETEKPQLGLAIPRRPPPSELNSLIASTTNSPLHSTQQLHPNFFQSGSPAFHPQQYFPYPYPGYAANAPSYIGGATMTSLVNPTIGMFGDMVFTRMFGSSEATMFPYPYTNSYPITGNNSPRMRRQEMQLDKSLSRLSLFMFCCFILCLLLF